MSTESIITSVFILYRFARAVSAPLYTGTPGRTAAAILQPPQFCNTAILQPPQSCNRRNPATAAILQLPQSCNAAILQLPQFCNTAILQPPQSCNTAILQHRNFATPQHAVLFLFFAHYSVLQYFNPKFVMP
jgi:hypothetical protein